MSGMVLLEEVADQVTVGHVGPMANEYVETGVPFLRSLNVLPHRIHDDEIKFITPEFHAKLRKSALAPGDVVIVRTGKPGTCAVIPETLADANCSDLVIVRCGPKLRPRYLAYWVNTIASEHVSSHTVGAVQQHFNVGSAKKMPVRLPDIEEQDRILEVLGALDDKIELNRKTAATLEAMARALYRSWFVDFDPVTAKSEGRAPAHMPPTTAALFPDRFGDDGLPEGWTHQKIDDLCTIKGGKQLTKDRFSDEGSFPVFGGAGLMGMTNESNADGFVITVGRVGAYCGNFIAFRGKAWVNNNASLISPAAKTPPEFLLLALQALDLSLIKKGAAQPFISNGDLKELTTVVPDVSVLEAFNDMAKTFRLRVEGLEAENQTLATLRDTLLPRLMSGELRVGEARDEVEAATSP